MTITLKNFSQAQRKQRHVVGMLKNKELNTDEEKNTIPIKFN
jgi:hypothetical protein